MLSSEVGGVITEQRRRQCTSINAKDSVALIAYMCMCYTDAEIRLNGASIYLGNQKSELVITSQKQSQKMNLLPNVGLAIVSNAASSGIVVMKKVDFTRVCVVAIGMVMLGPMSKSLLSG